LRFLRFWQFAEVAAILGAKQLKVGVLVRNEATHAFYRSGGFRDYTVQLVKPLNVEAR
jgi:hypothetical protein